MDKNLKGNEVAEFYLIIMDFQSVCDFLFITFRSCYIKKKKELKTLKKFLNIIKLIRTTKLDLKIIY